MRALLDNGMLTGGDGAFQPDVDRLSAPGHGVDYWLTEHGVARICDFDVDVDVDGRRRRLRPLIRYCVDWSEQRHHLAGAPGAALAQRMLELGWI